MNKLYLGEEFDITFAYQQLHIILWISLTFSSMMSLFYLLAFIFLLFKFWFEKFLVLYMHRKPTSFDEQIAVKQLGLFKVPIFLHVAFAILNYSSGLIFYNAKITPKNFGIENELILSYLPESFKSSDEV